MPKRVKEPTAVGDSVILPDDIYADNHPFVKAYPQLFVEAFDESAVIGAPRAARAKDVEQATANPGEKR